MAEAYVGIYRRLIMAQRPRPMVRDLAIGTMGP
jgi:hypothetical protein